MNTAQTNLNEETKILQDTFSTNATQIIDGKSNVASYKAAAGTNTAGGTLQDTGLVGSSSTTVNIVEYLARPKLLYSDMIDGYMAMPLVFQFAHQFLSSPDIQEKVKYHNLIRGTFEIKLIVTTLPYATGIVSLASSYDGLAQYGAFYTNMPLIVNNLSQKTHVDLDLASATQCLLSIPFHFKTPYVCNTNPDNNEIKRMLGYFFTKTQPGNTNQATTIPIYYKIYVSLKDAEVSVPAPIIGTYTAEMEEAMDGPISYPASVVSNVSKALSTVPVIGPFAMAFDIGATAVGRIAKMFGFSRPRDLSKPNYPHLVLGASGVGEVRSKNLTLDPFQEVTVDPSVFGEKGDNLSFQNTIMRYGLVDIKPWSQVDQVGDEIFFIPVSPTLEYSAGSGTYSPNPLSYAAILFEAWRGDLVFKITIPANRFVRGKLRVYWSPSITPSTLPIISNNSLSVLIDLTMSTELEITVPMMVENLYRSIAPHMYIDAVVDGSKNCNGFLHFIVEEPLVATNSGWTAQVLTSVKAGTNFELAVPTTKFISNLIYSLPPDPEEDVVFFKPNPITFTPPFQGATPPQQYNAFATYTAESNDVNPMLEDSVSIFPTIITDKPVKLHIGEDVKSLRTVLKRFNWYSHKSSAADAIYLRSIFIEYLPRPREFFNQTLGTWINTPIAHLSRMYGGSRGSMRYLFMDNMNTGPSFIDTMVSRGYFLNNGERFVDIDNKPENTQWLISYLTDGATFFKGNGEPVIFDVPYQNYHWFYPNVRKQNLTDYTYGAFVTTPPDLYGNKPVAYDIYAAIGEDFQFVIYNGPPIVNIYNPSYSAT